MRIATATEAKQIEHQEWLFAPYVFRRYSSGDYYSGDYYSGRVLLRCTEITTHGTVPYLLFPHLSNASVSSATNKIETVQKRIGQLRKGLGKLLVFT